MTHNLIRRGMASKPHQAHVALCKDDDIPAVFQVMSASFGADAPFVNAYFPKHDTDAGRERGTARLLAWKQGEPDSVFLKAVLPASGHDGAQQQQQQQQQQQDETIIGFAVWSLMKEPPNPDLSKAEEDVEGTWPDEEDRAWMTALWKDYVGPRGKAVAEAGDNGIWVLELLAVHPDYQRRGAATALVKWGTEKAQEQNLEAIVEGTAVGRPVYEKSGFRTEIDAMTFDVGDRFANRKKPALTFMRRKVSS